LTAVVKAVFRGHAKICLVCPDSGDDRGGEPSLVEFIRSARDFDALDLGRAADRGRAVDL
jgi:hypothetical protein